MRIYRT